MRAQYIVVLFAVFLRCHWHSCRLSRGYRTLLGDARILRSISSESLPAVPSLVRCSSWAILAVTRIVAIASGCFVANLSVVGQQP